MGCCSSGSCGKCSKCLSVNRNVIGGKKTVTIGGPCDCVPVQGNSFLPGYSPTQFLWNPNDIALFDVTTGLGSKFFTGWVAMNGNTYTVPGGRVTPPNMMNRLPIGGGDLYPLGTTGGAASVTISIAQLPAHTHTATSTLTNPTVTDPGHTHTVTDPGHTHTASQSAHSHAVTVTGHVPSGGAHHHGAWNTEGVDAGTSHQCVSPSAYSPNWQSVTGTNPGQVTVIGDDGAHEHTWTQDTGATDSQTPNVTVTSASTGVTIASHTTGISLTGGSVAVTNATTGSGTAVNILNPYFAGLWVTKLF